MRRLRENATLETEISKTGDVIVEGHTIGRLDGFMFAPDAAEAGSEAKALQAAAQKALAGEIDARAAKLAAGGDDQFALASDGTLRWHGDAVGKLTGADNVLEPRIRLVADDRLAGAPRESVQARLDLWLKAHVTRLLGPLFELSTAEDITGIARGIAFQLVEALGVIDRQRIAAEMKDLDQNSRASLRKYGVRFGAYHIYVPALLKPAARSLASLLWSLKHDNVDLAALTSAQHLASTGRTSFPADKALDRDAYRTLGYRLAGERAVRVDILERLADLIRPALAWREGSSVSKPPGAFDGRSFTVTQAMTSLTGSAGEDFASILRALGYRMDRRPPLPVQAAPAAQTAAAEPAATEATEPPGIVAANDNVIGGAQLHADIAEASSEAAPTADTSSAAVEETAPAVTEISAPAEAEQTVSATPDAGASQAEVQVTEAQVAEAQVAEAQVMEAQATQAQATEAPAAVSSDASASADTAVEAETAAAPAAEAAATPELIEVWRPGGRHQDRKPRHERPRHRRHDQAQAGEAGARSGEGEQGRGEHRRDRGKDFHRRRRHEFGKGEAAATAQASGGETSPSASEGGDARQREDRRRFQGKGKGRPDHGKGDRREQRHGGGGDRSGSQRPQRERPIDPNSPFAKLAALKEQLESSAKEKL
jgi:ATP-dependent RNA helicase SUPV3L1/SUV3